ncbi:hypothetical protein Trydic_g15327 [Trypoxylus dichotomus]
MDRRLQYWDKTCRAMFISVEMSIFQKDNEPKHASRLCKDFLTKKQEHIGMNDLVPLITKPVTHRIHLEQVKA